MLKRFFIPALVAAIAVVSISDRSYGDGTPAPVCYAVQKANFPIFSLSSLTYDTRRGVALSASVSLSNPTWATYRFDAIVPLQLGDEPNPHFDRLYSLLMKGADNSNGALKSVCLERAPTKDDDAVALVSVTLQTPEPSSEPQKVQICNGDGRRCANVNYLDEVMTSK